MARLIAIVVMARLGAGLGLCDPNLRGMRAKWVPEGVGESNGQFGSSECPRHRHFPPLVQIVCRSQIACILFRGAPLSVSINKRWGGGEGGGGGLRLYTSTPSHSDDSDQCWGQKVNARQAHAQARTIAARGPGNAR